MTTNYERKIIYGGDKMNKKDIINWIYSLFRLDLENEFEMVNDEIIIKLGNNETKNIKIKQIN